MRFWARLIVLLLLTTAVALPFGAPQKADPFRQLKEATPLPTRLDPAFEFRKTKLFHLGTAPPSRRGGLFSGGIIKDEAIGFEGAYRLHGAVTELDKRQRYGSYFDFFWRAKRDGPVVVRLEYRQEKLRAFLQAREVTYANGRGNHKTEFQVIGDDFFADGMITSWRCLLISNGVIVAEDRSFLWQ
jgi:hypothetical protein